MMIIMNKEILFCITILLGNKKILNLLNTNTKLVTINEQRLKGSLVAPSYQLANCMVGVGANAASQACSTNCMVNNPIEK
jgi:hypothetical protein